MKKLLIAGGVLAGLLIAGVFALYLSLGNIAVSMVEQHGSEMLGTRVTVDEVIILPFDGHVTLRGLKIKNPRGFEAENIFTLTEIAFKIDMGTLGDRPILVQELTLVEPNIYYELEFPEGNNIATLMRNIDAYQVKHGGRAKRGRGYGAPDGTVPEESGGGGEDQDIRLVIKDFRMLGAELFSGSNVKTPSLQKFPDFHIENVGADAGGATPAEVAKYIIGIIGKRMLGI